MLRFLLPFLVIPWLGIIVDREALFGDDTLEIKNAGPQFRRFFFRMRVLSKLNQPVEPCMIGYRRDSKTRIPVLYRQEKCPALHVQVRKRADDFVLIARSDYPDSSLNHRIEFQGEFQSGPGMRVFPDISEEMIWAVLPFPSDEVGELSVPCHGMARQIVSGNFRLFFESKQKSSEEAERNQFRPRDLELKDTFDVYTAWRTAYEKFYVELQQLERQLGPSVHQKILFNAQMTREALPEPEFIDSCRSRN